MVVRAARYDLEAALLQKPSVATYRVAALTYWIVIGLGLLKLTHYTLPNLLTEEPLIPEFMQKDFSSEGMAGAVGTFLDEPQRCEEVRQRFVKLREELALGSDERAAEAIIELAG